MPILAWLIGIIGTTFTSFCTWLITRFVYEKAVRYALITAFLVAASALTVSVSLAIKAAVFAVQVGMPGPLAQMTYFLPGNINQVLAVIVTARVARSIYRWTVATMSAYVPSNPRHGLLL